MTGILERAPGPLLRPFVQTLWAATRSGSPPPAPADRELTLPTGAMHLAIRLSDEPIRLYADPDDPIGRSVGHSVVGGARSGPYVRDLSGPACAIGVQLHPGASEILFGTPAGELAERHTPLDELWGTGASRARERLAESPSAGARLDLLEQLLADRLRRLRGLHPAVALALERFTVTADVRAVVREAGCSHRRFIDLFHGAVGLTPKRYCRLQRFRRALDLLTRRPADPRTQIALEAGYADQPHFTRDFREFTGMTPGDYRRHPSSSPWHVPVRRRDHRAG